MLHCSNTWYSCLALLLQHLAQRKAATRAGVCKGDELLAAVLWVCKAAGTDTVNGLQVGCAVNDRPCRWLTALFALRASCQPPFANTFIISARKFS